MAWQFRNGSYGEAYGTLTRVRPGLYSLTGRSGEDLGEWTDPDAAAVSIWEAYLAAGRSRSARGDYPTT